MNAYGVSYHTLIGSAGPFPREIGNCFAVLAEGEEWRIVNFVYENLEEALRLKRIDWPIRIKGLTLGIAVIHDERIPDGWYSSRFCEVCCPKSLLPLPQLLAHERQIARGDREENEHGVMRKFPGLTWKI